MEFIRLAEERFSVRDYQDRPIEQEKIDLILKAGQLAPTAANFQPQRIYMIRSAEGLAKIRAITRCAFNAPVVFMFAYDENVQWRNRLEEGITSGQQDVSIAAVHMMMEAWDLGIGSCWVDAFPNSETAKAFNLPENEKVVMLMPMGYPSDKAEPSPKHKETQPLDVLVKEL
ncbi:MAG: nitroreductase family protein [Solobacterium sp.]|nr:nitroreductase family protein [Solobacterium sp.]